MLGGLILLKPKRHKDQRGFFEETYSHRDLLACGLDCNFVQDNHAFTEASGVIRGLHLQSEPYAQDKLIRCSRGRILDIALDIRRSSETYGEHYIVELTAENGLQLFVPTGFAHGYCTLEDNCEVQYKVTKHYSAEHELGLLPTDSALGIDWNIANPQMSEKDRGLPVFKDFTSPFD